MAVFKITGINARGQKETFEYNNVTSEFKNSLGKPITQLIEVEKRGIATITSKDEPAGKATPRVLKISLGLSCNYECEYCSQRFVPTEGQTNPDNIDEFVSSMGAWVTSAPERIEFWGGEPLVYIKTLRPLAELLRDKFPDAEFSIITNGSLLNPEVNEWLDRMGFQVGVSHDGPGQHVRGPDPLDDAEKRSAILDLYARLAPKHRISFNTMMNRENTSRAAVQKFFIELTGDEQVPIGEGLFVDAYDEGGLASSLQEDEFAQYRNQAFHEIRTGQTKNFATVTQRIASFVNSIRTQRPASAVGQKCGMDRPDSMAVDLNGNVLTCQNVSAVSVAPNMESHKIGHVSDMQNVRLNTATHWSKRSECPNCPMLQICSGSCMFLEGRLWDASCDNAFSDAVPVFAAGMEFLTGFAPLRIDGPHREDRHDIWKASAKTAETPKKKIIPIALAA
jgi:uncharacterized protein